MRVEAIHQAILCIGLADDRQPTDALPIGDEPIGRIEICDGDRQTVGIDHTELPIRNIPTCFHEVLAGIQWTVTYFARVCGISNIGNFAHRLADTASIDHRDAVEIDIRRVVIATRIELQGMAIEEANPVLDVDRIFAISRGDGDVDFIGSTDHLHDIGSRAQNHRQRHVLVGCSIRLS